MNKKYIKKIVLKFLLLIEIAIFSYVYIFGKTGLTYLFNLRDENLKETEKISTLKNDIKILQQKISELDEDFYKEKIAREHLQLSKDNEKIYFY